MQKFWQFKETENKIKNLLKQSIPYIGQRLRALLILKQNEETGISRREVPKLAAHARESIRTALIQANHARLRPILMTTIAMVFGTFPIALASEAGAEWKNGLAWIIIGGLISSLFLTLTIVPVIYEIMEKIKAKLSKGEKIDYEAEMVADYDHKELSEDGFNPKHTV